MFYTSRVFQSQLFGTTYLWDRGRLGYMGPGRTEGPGATHLWDRGRLGHMGPGRTEGHKRRRHGRGPYGRGGVSRSTRMRNQDKNLFLS